MKKHLHHLRYALMAPLFIIASLVVSFTNVQLAQAATLTWTGEGDGTTFADGDNWSTDAAPVDGDVIAFTPLAGGTDGQAIYLENDLTGVELAGIVSTLSDSGNTKTFYIDTISFQANATLTTTGSGSKKGGVNFWKESDTTGSTATMFAAGNLTSALSLVGILDIDGNLTLTDSAYLSAAPGSSISGNLTAGSGFMYLRNSTVGGTVTVADEAGGLLIEGPTKTFSNDFVFNSPSDSLDNQLAFGYCAAPALGGVGSNALTVGCATYGTSTFTLSGDITLNDDLVIHVATKSTVNITGDVTYNGHTITKHPSSLGTLKVGGETLVVPKKTTTLSGSKPSDAATIQNRETATLKGERGSVVVQGGGLLKGTGTANTVYVAPEAIIAPGNSPGTLTVLNVASLSGTYEAELLNKDTYDQLRVGEDYTGNTNAVAIGADAILDIVLYDGWSIKDGDKFRIIDNRSDTDVSGDFADLAEGEQFEVTNEGVTITFSITYEGGDGNDVIITALNTGEDPTPPNTGAMQLVLGNPILVAVLGLATAGLLIFIALRSRRTA